MSGHMLPRVLLQAPLYNGIGRYIFQLQRVTLKFCKSRPDSGGMRSYIEEYLQEFAVKNPGIVVYLQPRRHRCPLIVGEYLNGHWQYVEAAKMSANDIHNWMELLRTRSGHDLLLMADKTRTFNPSTQGVWYPGLNDSPEEIALSWDNSKILSNLKELSAAQTLKTSATDIVQALFDKQMKSANSQ